MNDEAEPGLQVPPPPPQWLADEPGVLALLNDFIDKLNRQSSDTRRRATTIKLGRHNAAWLYRHDQGADRSWALIQTLQGLVYDIQTNPKRAPYDAEYVGAKLRLLDQGEAVCRAWLNRPRQPPYRALWVNAVEQYAEAFDDGGAALLDRPIRLEGKSAQAVVAAFAGLTRDLDTDLTLRQLSARCFWGHSKVLDTREELLRATYPGMRIRPRPLLVNVCLPESFSGVLFVENQDTYMKALAGKPAEVKGLALVYTAGFRGSAERIRSIDGASLHYQGACQESARAQFEDIWFGRAERILPMWFWGDLDYAGMTILKTLRQRFGDVRAWVPGYEALHKALLEECGHSAQLADKAEQLDPVRTGCDYADQVLLPLLRSSGRFVDQELV